MDDPYIDNTTERSMDEQTRKALELARATLEWPADYDADAAIAAIDAAIDAALSAPDLNLSDTAVQKRLAAQWGYVPAPAAPVARCLYCDDTGDVHTPTGEWRGRCTCAAAVPVARPLPACHVAVIGNRWDSERLRHVSQLLIEFKPVPANTGNTAKGWVDRDSLAKILNGIGQREDDA